MSGKMKKNTLYWLVLWIAYAFLMLGVYEVFDVKEMNRLFILIFIWSVLVIFFYKLCDIEELIFNKSLKGGVK